MPRSEVRGDPELCREAYMRRFLMLIAGCVMLASFLVATSGGATQAQARWVITDLGTLGGPVSEPTALNDSGQIVGHSGVVMPNGRLRRHAFLWEKGRMRDLGTLPGNRYSQATDINERGQVVGWVWNSSDGMVNRGFLWEKGKMRDLGPLDADGFGEPPRINDGGQVLLTRCASYWQEPYGDKCHAQLWENGRGRPLDGKWSSGKAVNERGQVIGLSADARDDDGDPMWHAFIWEGGKTRTLGTQRTESAAVAMNERGQVLGCRGAIESLPNPCSGNMEETPLTPLLWQAGKARTLGTLGGDHSVVVGLNNRGEVIGESETDRGAWHAFLWRNGTIRDLGTLGGKTARPAAINDRGQVIGNSETGRRDKDGYLTEHPFVWENGTLTDLAAPDAEVTAINNHAWIIGWSWTKRGERAVLWAPKR
jgi:probable HAF family extracellular repeat protein